MRRTVRWQTWGGEGLEHLEIWQDADAIHADGMLIGHGSAPYALHYRLRCDAYWHCRSACLTLVGSGERLELHSDGRGNWQDGEGRPLAALRGCIDLDITATPFTNTLPIRRLGLGAGAAQTVRVVWVKVPTLDVEAVDQRYTCLQPGGRYRFEGLRNRCEYELAVDADGLVIEYPSLFRRLI